MGMSELQSLMRHMGWADGLIWKAVVSTPALQQDQDVRDRLHHFHATQWAYLQIWRGEVVHIPELSSFADLRSLGRWARGFHHELPEYADALQEDTLSRIVEFPWAERIAERFGTINPATLAETILQLAVHSAHHRGQVATRIRERGGEPPTIDFLAWVWMGRPTASWDSIEAG
jgi:uncharacterized damage-inducible protein DinB